LASIGLISSKASVEGPLGNGAFFIGGRRTDFDAIRAVLPEDEESPFPDFGFYDLNAKVTQNIGKNDKISISGFEETAMPTSFVTPSYLAKSAVRASLHLKSKAIVVGIFYKISDLSF
jgi:hypothetical protein